jgi:hypothetical protein
VVVLLLFTAVILAGYQSTGYYLQLSLVDLPTGGLEQCTEIIRHRRFFVLIQRHIATAPLFVRNAAVPYRGIRGVISTLFVEFS